MNTYVAISFHHILLGVLQRTTCLDCRQLKCLDFFKMH